MDRTPPPEVPVSEENRGKFSSALKSRDVVALEGLWKASPSDYQRLVAEKAKQIGDQITGRRDVLSVDEELALREKFGKWFEVFPGVDRVRVKTREEILAERASLPKPEVPQSASSAPVEKFDDYKKRMAALVDTMDQTTLLREARKLNRSSIFFPKWFDGVVNGNGESSADDLNKLREWFKNPDMGELVATV